VIDLHTHTVASDGCLTPRELVRRAAQRGVTVLAITDHDTLAGLPEARADLPAGVELVDGVEITAVESERDVHVLGYFVVPGPLEAFLAVQRQARLARVRAIGERLERLGVPIDVAALLAAHPGDEGSVGRPAVARALIAAGHVDSIPEAFTRYLGRDGAAFVPRTGPDVATVVAKIHEAGGLASLAHPVLNKCDDRIAEWATAGLDALEAYHTEHDEAATARYRALASALGLAVTGGSDFHSDEPSGRARLGGVTLPREEFERFARRRPTA
jgi:predicted metal-dependent phosphoesterase TrpH